MTASGTGTALAVPTHGNTGDQMRLPNARLAVVSHRKVVDYLLDSLHPDNAGKAAFFARLGYAPSRAGALARALAEVGRLGAVVDVHRSRHGEKYVVDGLIAAHTEGQGPRWVRTVWIVEAGTSAPRLVTAYPGKGGPP